MQSIGEVAESLDLPQHVLRFWETRFREINPLKRAGGRRLYRARDIEIVVTIRHLLYSEGYTIKGVQRILKEQGVDAVVADIRRRLSGESAPDPAPASEPEEEADIAASDGEIDEQKAEAEFFAPAYAEPGADAAFAEAPTQEAYVQAIEPPSRRVDETHARILRDALDEIEECLRLLKLTQR